MRRGPFFIVLAGLLLASCSSVDEFPSTNGTDSAEGTCGEVTTLHDRWWADVDRWQRTFDDLTRQVEGNPTELFDGGLTESEFNTLTQLERDIPSQKLTIAYLVADNPECFTPGQVAEAKAGIEYLENQFQRNN